MKKNQTVLAFVMGVLLTAGVVQAAPGLDANANADANVDVDANVDAVAEGQPHMRAAIAALRTAREQLDKASADKGGHRAKAIRLVKDAIDEVQAGIDFDNADGKK